jgi:hypothetical protein
MQITVTQLLAYEVIRMLASINSAIVKYCRSEYFTATYIVLYCIVLYCIPVASIFVGAWGIRETFSFHVGFLI